MIYGAIHFYLAFSDTPLSYFHQRCDRRCFRRADLVGRARHLSRAGCYDAVVVDVADDGADRLPSGMCYLSEAKLKRGFKACFGCTVYEYVVEKRMEMACRLLQSGKYRVKDVVWMTGYSNAGHFIDTFRKRYGVTPSEIS